MHCGVNNTASHALFCFCAEALVVGHRMKKAHIAHVSRHPLLCFWRAQERVVALAYDYDLWWRRGPWEAVSWPWGAASAVSSRESNAGLFHLSWGELALPQELLLGTGVRA